MISFRGVMAALATPLRDDGSLDETALARLIDRILAAGVQGICPVGSTGEGPHLSRRVRLQVTSAAMRIVGGRVPVMPAATTPVAEDALEDVKAYAGAGAQAALVAPPFYYPLSARGLESFFTTLADASPLPILIYNIPQFTKVPVPPEVAGRLAQHPRIAGMKDSSRDYEYFCAVAGATHGQDFSLLTGSDTMLVASLIAGGHGAIAGSVNLVPGLVVEVYDAAMAGDFERARPLQDRLRRIVLAGRVGPFPAGLKAGLELAGLCLGRPAAPTEALPAADREALAAELRRLEVI